MLAIAAAVSVLATVAGTYVAHVLHREAGPVVVLIAGACFGVSLLSRRATQ